MGDLWPCFQGPQLYKLGFRGGVRIYNPPLTKLSIRLFYPRIFASLLGPLVPLGPLGRMGTHALVTRVWGTLIEANFH